MAFVRKALSFRQRGRYNVQEAKENRFPTRSLSSYKPMDEETEETNSKIQNQLQSEKNMRDALAVAQVSQTVKMRRGQSTASVKVATAIRDTFGTIRQKMRSSIRRRKRLNTGPNTPASTLRRSLRIKTRTPKEACAIDSPQSVRLNKFQPKRCNFSSPGQLNKDLETVSTGIESLAGFGAGAHLGAKVQRTSR